MQSEFLSDQSECTTETIKQIIDAVRRSPRLSKIVSKHQDEIIIKAISDESILFYNIITFMVDPKLSIRRISELQANQSMDPAVRLEKWLKDRQS
jgi:hypothetical protein